MNFKKNGTFLAGLLTGLVLLAATGCSTAMPYKETRTGNYLYLNPLSYKPATPQDHLNYAMDLKKRGHLKSARKQFEILVKRWPDSAEAATAKQAAADIYFEQGKNKKAFTAYEELIQQYYTDIKDYNAILDRQYTLATREMDRKRMRWLFGGYLAPEQSVPLFESIIKNAPQWERAPEMQYMIGQAYQKNDDQELAVVAYSTVEYRYPDSPFAEKAGVAKIESFKNLVESTPYSLEIREQAQLSARMFPELYTNSQHLAEAQAFSKELHNTSAEYYYEIGRFYERVPRPPQNNSAAIYYNKVIKNYGDTEYAAKAAARLRVLFPGGEATLADGTRAPIVPVVDAEPGTGTAAAVAGGGGGGRAQVHSLPDRLSTDPEAIEITADRMEYSGDLLIGEGNVAVQQKDASLQADRVTVNSQTGEIRANGNILMIRDGSRWEGQELVYNYKTREGTFGKSFMYFEPAYITAEKTERISTNEFLMHDAMITTCSGENPTVYAKAKEVRVINNNGPRGALIKAKHVTFYVGPVPIFYTPYFERDLGASVFNVVAGVGGNYGAFIKTRTTLHPTEWLTSKTHLDLYSQRGIGLGQDFEWKTPRGGGKIETYYINDSDPQNDHDLKSYQELVDSQRYRIKLTDREQINRETYFATKLNWLSDPLITRDFFNTEYKNEANPENYAVVQHSAEDHAASLRVDHRLNDFYNTVNRMPELTYDKYRSQLGDSPFHFENQNNLSFLENQYSSTNRAAITTNKSGSVISTNVIPDDYHAGRFDTYNQLFLPMRFNDFLNVIPRAGYRGTFYSATGTNATESADYRSIFELGTLTSFKAYKTLSEKSAFYGDGLRHVIEPYADYSWRPKPNLGPEDLPQFDSIDALDEQNEVKFGARNFLQTKRSAKRIVNFLDTDVYTIYRFDPATGEKSFSNLVADAEMSLTDHFSIYSDLEYNYYTHKLTPANARLKYVTDDQSEYSFEYRFLDGTRELFTPRVKLFPNDKWSYEASFSYDRTHDDWYERKILVTHKFDCVGMGAGIKINEYNETQFWVQFWLLAFPQDPMDAGF